MDSESGHHRTPLVQKNAFKIGQLYQFHPVNNLSKLMIFRSPEADCRSAFVIRRKSILIVLAKERHYYKVACSGCEGWINLSEPLLADNNIFAPIDSYRAYEDWRGNNYFFFQGYVMLGSHAAFFLAAIIYITTFAIIFFVYIHHKVEGSNIFLVRRC